MGENALNLTPLSRKIRPKVCITMLILAFALRVATVITLL